MPKEWAGRPVYAVSEIVRLLASELEQAFPDLWVEGEVTSFKRAASGHCYFTLKDESASLKAVLFRTHALRVPFSMENGLKILARGRLSLYEGSGDLQLYVTAVEPSGLGALQMAFEQAKRRLMAEGITDPARKRPLPPFPVRVGVVTSLEGAALRDFLSVLRRRRAAFEVVVAPALVQGAGAPESLRRALARVARRPGMEVVVLTRGGGSMEDLWAFNDEGLARDVASCAVPVISAVGHEVDTVLTDLTADLRAPTPSVAAELLTSMRDSALQRAGAAERRLFDLSLARLASCRQSLAASRPDRLRGSLVKALERAQERSDRAVDAAARAVSAKLAQGAHRLELCRRTLSPEAIRRTLAAFATGHEEARRRMRAAVAGGLERRRERFGGLARTMNSLSPLNTLGRGYAAAFLQGGRSLTSSAQAPPGTRVSLALRDGGLDCAVLSHRASALPEVLRTRSGPAVDSSAGAAVTSGFEEKPDE